MIHPDAVAAVLTRIEPALNWTRIGDRAAVSGWPIAIERPVGEQCLPLVFCSPHSGAVYPADFVESSLLDPLALRRSEDSFVDELFGAGPLLGAPLLRALFPRAYCDPNREPYELDPHMFGDALPAFVNTTSVRVAGGLGTIARIVSNGAEIYRDKLLFAEAERRIDACWRPYHDALAVLLENTRAQFGMALLIDCHSMPSTGCLGERDHGRRRADIVLGDRHGASCSPLLIRRAEGILHGLGFRTARNAPYAGGYTTEHYGRPDVGFHALQIEINRGLYMDEERIERGADFDDLANRLTLFIGQLAATDWTEVGQR